MTNLIQNNSFEEEFEYEGEIIDLSDKLILFPSAIGNIVRSNEYVIYPFEDIKFKMKMNKSDEKLIEILNYYHTYNQQKHDDIMRADIIYYDFETKEWYPVNPHPRDEIHHHGAKFHWPPVNPYVNQGLTNEELMHCYIIQHSAAPFTIRIKQKWMNE